MPGTGEGGRTAAGALVADLMFASRVSGAVRVAGVGAVTVVHGAAGFFLRPHS